MRHPTISDKAMTDGEKTNFIVRVWFRLPVLLLSRLKLDCSETGFGLLPGRRGHGVVSRLHRPASLLPSRANLSTLRSSGFELQIESKSWITWPYFRS